jgi:hypothetical protein
MVNHHNHLLPSVNPSSTLHLCEFCGPSLSPLSGGPKRWCISWWFGADPCQKLHDWCWGKHQKLFQISINCQLEDSFRYSIYVPKNAIALETWFLLSRHSNLQYAFHVLTTPFTTNRLNPYRKAKNVRRRGFLALSKTRAAWTDSDQIYQVSGVPVMFLFRSRMKRWDYMEYYKEYYMDILNGILQVCWGFPKATAGSCSKPWCAF